MNENIMEVSVLHDSAATEQETIAEAEETITELIGV